MTVLMISGKDLGGGASIAAHRLAKGLENNGASVVRVVFSETHEDSEKNSFYERPYNTIEVRPLLQEGALRWLLRKFHWLPTKGIRPYINNVFVKRLRDIIRSIDPDVINVHNIHGPQWGTKVLATCAEHRKTVYTLHDMWSFTGGCTYSYDCRRFIDGCTAECPVAKEHPPVYPGDIERYWRRKVSVLEENDNLHAVAISEWLKTLACEGGWPDERVHLVRNGLEVERFEPKSKLLSRKALGLTETDNVVFTYIPGSRRKGSLTLGPILRGINDDISILTVGNGALDSIASNSVIHLGYIEDPERMSLVYNAADLYLHPAPIDNYPNTVLEALACNTPVFGFGVGGVGEMVDCGRNGYLTEGIKISELSSLINNFFEGNLDALDGGSSNRGKYCNKRQAREYEAIFKNMS